MARPLRVQFEGAFYHVFARGNRKEHIFYSYRDYSVFLEKLAEAAKKYSLLIYAYALMPNHYHLAVETPFANLSEAIHFLNSAYTNWFREKHQIVGPIFQGRFKSVIVDKDSYLLSLVAYIHLNPVKGRLAESPEKYLWSSHRFYVKEKRAPEWLAVGPVLSMFSSGSGKGRKAFHRFVTGFRIDLEQEIKKGFILGDESFVNMIQERVKSSRLSPEIPEAKRLMWKVDAPERAVELIRKIEGWSEKEVFSPRSDAHKITVYLLKKFSPFSLQEIAELFKTHYSSLTVKVKRFEKRMANDRKLREKVEEIKKRYLSNVKT